MSEEKQKRCTKCGVEKRVAEFGKAKNAKDGLNWNCKECVRDAQNSRYKAHRGRGKPAAATKRGRKLKTESCKTPAVATVTAWIGPKADPGGTAAENLADEIGRVQAAIDELHAIYVDIVKALRLQIIAKIQEMKAVKEKLGADEE